MAIVFNNAEEFIDTLVNNECDLYNPKTGDYVFHYNDKDAIAVYSLTKQEAEALAKEDDYWGAYLGFGGRIYDNPTEYAEEHYSDEGWLTCDDFAKDINGIND